MTNIYIGNLSYGIKEEGLKEIFEEFGDVSSAKIIKDRETGRSKGFGFVEMAEESEANQAIENLNGKEIEGRSVNVSIAKPRKENFSNEG